VEEIALLEKCLSDRAHSFAWIRRHTGLKLSDKQFDEIIRKHPEKFVPQKIARKDDNGNKVKPSWRGMKLNLSAGN
jgi:hypothetical protein